MRFVTSIEQIAPYLDELELECDYDDGDDSEIQQLTGRTGTDGDRCPPESLLVPVALPPASSAHNQPATAATATNIYEEYVNFIDLSVLNPIIDASCCQRDQLIESEISEQSCGMCSFISVSLFTMFGTAFGVWRIRLIV